MSMPIEEKYRILREAALAVVGLPDDDKADLLGLTNALNNDAEADPDTKAVSLQLLVALLQTHGE